MARGALLVLCGLQLALGLLTPGPARTRGRPAGASLNMAAALRPGSNVALVTPMTETNEVDVPALRRLVQWHVDEGSDGLVILGTTGEASTLSMDERAAVIEATVEVVDGRVPVVVGTGTIEPGAVVSACKHAKKHGADACLVVTPYYVKPPQRALVEHFSTIADEGGLPVVLYNVPGRTGVDMTPATIAQLAQHPNVVGVKDATGDLSRVRELRDLCGEDFGVFSGEDDSGMEFVSLGGDGVISVTANVAPRKMHAMLAAARDGRAAEAEELNAQLDLLHRNLFLESNPIPAKAALRLMGRIGGGIRPPLCALDPALEPQIAQALAAAGVEVVGA